VARYIGALAATLKAEGYIGDLLILHSGGGVLTAEGARRDAARVASSGIVAGAIAGAHIARECGFANAISLDMGGTSTDISLMCRRQRGRNRADRIPGRPKLAWWRWPCSHWLRARSRVLPEPLADPTDRQPFLAPKLMRAADRASDGRLVDIRHDLARMCLFPAEQASTPRIEALFANGTFIVPVLSRRQFRDIMELRALLEGRATARACGRVDDAAFRRLHKYSAELDAASKDADIVRYLEVNQKLKFTIYACCTSSTLRGLIELLWLQAGPVLRYHSTVLQDITKINFHREAIAGLKRRNRAAASRAIARDIKAGMRALLRVGQFRAEGDVRKIDAAHVGNSHPAILVM
jgi:hypothetical protein